MIPMGGDRVRVEEVSGGVGVLKEREQVERPRSAKDLDRTGQAHSEKLS